MKIKLRTRYYWDPRPTGLRLYDGTADIFGWVEDASTWRRWRRRRAGKRLVRRAAAYQRGEL